MKSLKSIWPWFIWLSCGVVGVGLYVKKFEPSSELHGVVIARTHSILSERAGHIRKLNVSLGQKVKEGDVLFSLSTKKNKNLDFYHAPFNGIVSDLSVDQGQYIERGKTLLKVVSSEEFSIEAYLLEGTSLSPSDGQPVVAVGKNQNFQGIVMGISPILSKLPMRLRGRSGLGSHGRKVIIGRLSSKPEMIGEVVKIEF